MPDPTFRGDPYGVLGVSHAASSSEIKRRWRDLALEHHPDRSVGDSSEYQRLTSRMARINSAYDLLRDPVRRARYDASPAARRRQGAESGGRNAARPTASDGPESSVAGGPPPARATRPVTARYDTTATYHGRNTTTSRGRTPLAGHPPVGRRRGEMDLRASTPTGPVERHTSGPPPRLPTLESARSTALEFGRFHGHTLGQVADLEPSYIDWIARTITRDRDLVVRARVIQADLEERGVERAVPTPPPASADIRGRPEAAEASPAG